MHIVHADAVGPPPARREVTEVPTERETRGSQAPRLAGAAAALGARAAAGRRLAAMPAPGPMAAVLMAPRRAGEWSWPVMRSSLAGGPAAAVVDAI